MNDNLRIYIYFLNYEQLTYDLYSIIVQLNFEVLKNAFNQQKNDEKIYLLKNMCIICKMKGSILLHLFQFFANKY